MQKHVYIIGATGTGKTTMIQSMAKEDIEKGKGLCVIDPHGDLIEKALEVIPESRIKDLIYFNPHLKMKEQSWKKWKDKRRSVPAK